MTNDEQPPADLWHYTTMENLENILSSRTLWLTHASHLNDPLERHLVYSAFENLIPQQDELLQDALGGGFTGVVDQPYLAPFVSSFSANSDNLLLWTSYSKHVGVSIQVDSKELRRLTVGEYGVDLKSVYYGNNYATDAAARIMAELASQVAVTRKTQAIVKMKPIRMRTPEVLAQAATGFKTEGWRQEEEWRIVWRRSIPFVDPEDPQHFASLTELWQDSKRNSYVTLDQGRPHVEAAIDPRLLIKRIILGPCADRSLAQQILEKHSLDVPLDRSPTIIRCKCSTSPTPLNPI